MNLGIRRLVAAVLTTAALALLGASTTTAMVTTAGEGDWPIVGGPGGSSSTTR
jgi:H+/gluconate symporter-like permease